MLNRHFRAGLAIGVLTLAACGDSTAPRQVTPAQLAQHIDSLLRQADNQARANALNNLAFAPALGASPVKVALRTRAGNQEWQGFAFRCIVPEGCGDSTFVIAAYSDYNLSNVLIGSREYTGTEAAIGVDILTGDSTLITGGSGTISITQTSTGSKCLPATGFNNGWAQFSASCNLSTFEGSISWTYPAGDGGTTAYQSVQIEPQTFNGVFVK